MSEINLTSVQFKLKLNKIRSEIDEKSGEIRIGKAKTSWLELGIAVGLILISIVLSYAYSTVHETGRINKLIGFFCVAPGIAGAFMLTRVYIFKKENQTRKTISKFGLTIEDKKSIFKYLPEEIARFETKITTEDSVTQGRLFVVSVKGEKKLLFTLFGENRNYLVSDLEFIKSQFEKIVRLI